MAGQSHLTPIVQQIRQTLSLEDWHTVRAKIDAYHKLAGDAPATKPASTDDYLLAGIYVELRRRGLLAEGARLRVPPRFHPASELVRGHLEARTGPLKPPQRFGLGQVAIRALAEYLERAQVPIGPTVLFNCVGKVPTALEASFPGYLEAGLIQYCCRS